MIETVWLAADYHIPITYSCRMPFSSPHTAQCLPAPGPATVKLALIRNSIELFGVPQTRDVLFPLIRNLEVRIKPPSRVAVSTQALHSFKANETGLAETIGYREFAYTYDELTIFVKIPTVMQNRFTELLNAIGYWGQANSLTFCQQVYEAESISSETIQPLRLANHLVWENHFTAFVIDWKKENVTWNKVTGTKSAKFLEPVLYIFPLEFHERQNDKIRLVFLSLMDRI